MKIRWADNFPSAPCSHRKGSVAHVNLPLLKQEYQIDENPTNDEGDGEISKVSFDELVKGFPDLQTSTSSQILSEVKKLKKELDELKKVVEENQVKKEEKDWTYDRW